MWGPLSWTSVPRNLVKLDSVFHYFGQVETQAQEITSG